MVAADRFTVMLPWRSAPGVPVVLAAANGSPKPRRLAPATVLVVEDNDSNLLTLRAYLEALGLRVVEARDGREGVTAAVEFQPGLILMDVQMPRMDGLEATRLLRVQEATRAIPVVALTALAMPGDREKCLAAGMDDYLVKPVDLGLLERTLRRYLETGDAGREVRA